MERRTRALALLGVALAAAACEDLGTGAERMPEVSLSLAVPGAPGSALAARTPTGDAAGRTLELRQVQLLLRSAELKLRDDDSCAGEDDDACEKFVTRAVLVDLPVEGGTITPFTEPIRPGVYDELRIRVREPSDDRGDRARFLAEHPDWPRGASVRVRGTFDAGDGAGPRPFDTFIEVEAEVRQRLSPPLVVDASTTPTRVNLTLSVDLAGWFRTRDGRLIDPRRLAGDDDLADRVEENVERSFAAFRDDDRDGRHGDDDDGDDDDGDDDDGDDDDDDGGVDEVEGRVSSVSVAAGTFTMASGRVVRLTSTTVIEADGDLRSLAAAAEAVAAGRPVRAEAHGSPVTEGGGQLFVATRVKFEVDD